MLIKTRQRRVPVLSMTFALLAATAAFGLQTAHAQDRVGLLTVVGMVKVNGQPAATGDIVSSGSGVETAKGSSAVVSLGKLGRVEALPETRMRLRYDGTSISVLLDAGSVRVQTGEGVSATIKAKE